MDRPEIPCFWGAENWLNAEVDMDRNLKRSKGSFQHEKCFILCVDYPSGISEPLDKWKIKFMLKNYKLV